jgi:hypothetical protein
MDRARSLRLLYLVGAVMAEDARLLFDKRFMEPHAGSIIVDPAVAIVELVASAWDAWTTKVDIVWPAHGIDTAFVIEDSGKGMTEAQFQTRWKALDYNRLRDKGTESAGFTGGPNS